MGYELLLMYAVMMEFFLDLTDDFEFPRVVGDVVVDPPPRFDGLSIWEILSFFIAVCWYQGSWFNRLRRGAASTKSCIDLLV